MNAQWHEIMMTRLDAVIAERDELKKRLRERLAEAKSEHEALENMRQRLVAVLAERDEMKISMRLWMAAALALAASYFITSVVLFITTFAF